MCARKMRAHITDATKLQTKLTAERQCGLLTEKLGWATFGVIAACSEQKDSIFKVDRLFDFMEQHNFSPSPYAAFIFLTQQLLHYYDNLINGDNNPGQANQKGAGRGKGKPGNTRRNDDHDEPLSTGPIAAEGLAMQCSTTATAYMGKVTSIARIADDWDSINIAFTKTTKQSFLSAIPHGREEYGPATWTSDPALTGPNVGIQVGQFLSINFREWQSGTTQDTATASSNDPEPKGQTKGDTHLPSNPLRQDGLPTPADGLGPSCGSISNADTTNQLRKPAMMKWAVQGLVQEIQAPDKSCRKVDRRFPQ